MIDARMEAGLTQQTLSERVGRPQSYLGKIETFERRLDALELFDLLSALRLSAADFAHKAERALGHERKAKRH
ncbi:MAG: helix-turn-helix transcriptional regulator [Terricaulis sp.]